MPKAQILLDNRYAILHIERIKNFSQVFFALDTYQNPARNCVIKAFRPMVQKPQIAHRIRQEFCQAADRLKRISLVNQHLPQIYTYFIDSQTYYLVQELVEGKTLKEKVQTEGNLAPQEVRAILVKLLSVLSYLHQQGVIHQNIQPKNIILRRDDRVPMLINFGTIRQVLATIDFDGDRPVLSLKDTCNYIPAEQAFGKPIPASDLYSLGLTAIYLLTGKNPLDLT
ncbi:serine/threonine protein kinase [Pleurocapsales cyanobacterium LEGE 10410]|nr:serine/threonine protein kinase [Pleurocapsales cyanobacterium LEGE 10410]